MSIETIKGNIAFACDYHECEDGLETGTNDFGEAKSEAQEAGWLFRKRKGFSKSTQAMTEERWLHFCCTRHEEAQFRCGMLA